MIDSRLLERRFRAWDPNLKPGWMPCRLCLRVVAPGSESVETTDLHVYVRCPECGHSFPVRHSDVPTLAGPPASAA